MKTKDLKEKKEPIDNQVIHLHKKIEGLERDISKLNEQLGSKKEFEAQLISAVQASDPFPKFHYTRASNGHTPIMPVLNLSDWHTGEVIKRNETEGFGEYSFAIQQRRIFSIVNDFLQWVEVNRKFYTIEDCTLNELGDFVSGDIHEELLRTNEFPLPVQAVKAGMLLGELHRIIAPHFKNVIVNQIGADNHGRMVKKPQSKQAASNNMNFVVYSVANVHAEKSNNIYVNTNEGIKVLARINGKKFLLEHGDSIRGGELGIPMYSIIRMRGKEAARRMNTNKGFDYWQIGHFHAPTVFEKHTLINGSLSGTSEHDHKAGRYAEPCQVAYLIHPKHGLFDWTPFQESPKKSIMVKRKLF
jgi:hypothetical protein